MSLVNRHFSKYIEVYLEYRDENIALVSINNEEIYIDARDIYETEDHAYITLEYYETLKGNT